jgi:phosphohistidine phosphatase
MLIYFLRHGDASSDSRYQDSERPLTELGNNQALNVGNFIRRINADINLILTSPILRASQTGQVVQSIVRSPRIETTEYLLNGTDPDRLFKHIAGYDVECVLLVGHEPFLSDTIALLIGGDHNTYIPMRKCSLALVEVQEPIRPGTGMLSQLTHVALIAEFIKL